MKLVRSFNLSNDSFALDVKEQRLSDDFDSFLWGDSAPKLTELENKRSSKKVMKKRRKTGTTVPKFEIKRTAENLPMTDENLETMQFIRDYTPHMLAIYGWKLLVYMDTIQLRPFRSIGKLLRMPRLKNDSRFHTERDNCCRCEGSTLLRQTDLSSDDIVYASFTNIEGQQVPYAVMVDHKLHSVVFTCRGSLSLQDIITDMLIEPEPLNKCGREWGFDGEGHYAHRGFFKCAETIRQRLQRSLILHTLLGVEPVYKVDESVIDDEDPDHKLKTKLSDLPHCRGYNLVVVGHSLGAGVAAILSLMLRPEFPNVQCIAYSSPGCVFDIEMARESKAWIVSPFVGKDFVSHLSWESLNRLRGQTLDMLRRSKTNKGKIFETIYKKKKVESLLYEYDEIPDTPKRNEIAKQIEELATSTNNKFERIKMHNAGRVLHFAKVSTTKKGCFKRKRKYEPTWVDSNDMQDLEISTRMLLDHFPNYVAFIINEVANEYIPPNL
uniref:sn-1-specific diacylglycerol lipase n=1 Tax=Aplanochytrium stocchinoi TaxID=215587 RepID=A0A7S3V146_9STRA